MDANVYKARLKELKKAFANVDRRIKLFGPEDVTLEDYLEETRKLLVIEAQDVTKNNDCEKQLDDLTISKKTIEQDAIGIHDNEHVKNTFDLVRFLSLSSQISNLNPLESIHST